MEANKKQSLKERIYSGEVTRQDVVRRLAELAFGRANDCVRLALEDAPDLKKLDLSLLSEVKRNDKGTVEVRLLDRLEVLQQLAVMAGKGTEEAESFLRALQGGGEE